MFCAISAEGFYLVVFLCACLGHKYVLCRLDDIFLCCRDLFREAALSQFLFPFPPPHAESQGQVKSSQVTRRPTRLDAGLVIVAKPYHTSV